MKGYIISVKKICMSKNHQCLNYKNFQKYYVKIKFMMNKMISPDLLYWNV